MQALTSPKISPTLFGERAALQPAACGLCSPATGGTGAAASCGVARAASRDDRERPTVPLGTAQSRRTCASGCFSAGLCAVAATGEIVPHLDRIRPGRQLPQPGAIEMWDNRTVPPRTATMSAPLFSARQYIPTSRTHLDPANPRQGCPPSRTPFRRP